MNKLPILLFILSSSVYASETINDVKNPYAFNSHHIQITKEEKRKFLFIPYTKEVTINEISLNGYTGNFNSQNKTSYLDSVSEIDNNIIIKSNVLTTGLAININMLENDFQSLTFNKKDLLTMDNLKSNDLTIQLPATTEISFSIPINNNSFEKTWADSSGITYHLKYFGEKQ